MRGTSLLILGNEKFLWGGVDSEREKCYDNISSTNEEKDTINIDETVLERFGSHSLTGRLYNLDAKVGDEIVLQFDTPEPFIYCAVPSYVPWLLCEDVLRLVTMGFKVRVTNHVS